MKAMRASTVILGGIFFYAISAHAGLAPNERLSLVQLGIAYIEQWDVAKARSVLEQLAPEHGDETPVGYLRAQVLFHEGDYAGAKKALAALPTTPVMRHAAEFIKLVDDTVAATRGMVRHDTPHFSIYYLPGKDDVLIPYAADALEKAYERIGADLQYKPPEKVRVEIYPDSERFIAVTTLTKQEIETSGTIALCKFNRLMITSPRVLVRGYGYLDTLVHEYVHFVLSRKTNNQIPLWLHEGVAKFEEARWRKTDVADISPTSQSLLAEALESNYFITLEQMYPSLAKLKRAEDTQLAFAQVVTMVGLLVRKGGYPMLLELIKAFNDGKSDDEALRLAGGWPNRDAFLQEWRAYLRERGLKPIPGLRILKTKLKEAGESEDSEDLRAIADKTVKKHLRLGDKLRDSRRFKASVHEYQRAKESKAGFDPIVMHKLGLAQMLAGDLDGAIGTFQETLDVYPSFGPVNRRLGEAYVAKKDYVNARAPLEAAVGINPFDPAIHVLLIETYRQTGDAELLAREEKVLALLKGNR